MGLWSIFLAILLVAGCTGGLGAGVSEDLSAALRPCDDKEGDLREWCAVQVLEVVEPSGADRYTVCGRLSDRAATDWCLDSASRGKAPFTPDDTCDGVRSDQLRYSCQIAIADRISRNGTLPEAVAACRSTGELLRFCLYHIPVHRKEAYRGDDGMQKLVAEVQYIAATIPESSEMTDLGFGVARAVMDLRSRDTAACLALPDGVAREACVSALASGDVNLGVYEAELGTSGQRSAEQRAAGQGASGKGQGRQ